MYSTASAGEGLHVQCARIGRQCYLAPSAGFAEYFVTVYSAIVVLFTVLGDYCSIPAAGAPVGRAPSNSPVYLSHVSAAAALLAWIAWNGVNRIAPIEYRVVLQDGLNVRHMRGVRLPVRGKDRTEIV